MRVSISALLQIGLSLLLVGDALLGVADVLGLFLFNLMFQIVELGLRLAQQFDFVRAVESSKRSAGCNRRTVVRQRRQRQIAALALDPGNADSNRLDCAHNACCPDRTARRDSLDCEKAAGEGDRQRI